MSTYQTSHKTIYERYHGTDNPITKRSYLDILKRRASHGSSEAKALVSKIERGKCAT